MYMLNLVQLPPGYRAEWVEGHLRLFDPQGHPLAIYPARPTSFATIEEHAWEHAWAQIEAEMRQEIKALRSGTRNFAELRRMKQYVRLIEAFAGVPPETEAVETTREPVPLVSRRSPRLARLAVAGGLAAAGLLAVLLYSAEIPTPPLSKAPPPGPEAVAPSQPSRTGPESRRPAPQPVSGEIPRAARIERQVRPAAGYAVTFGRFASLEAAQGFARRIRSKGYLATVVRAGNSFRVLGRIYSSRTQAERMARILREIALPATVQPAGL